MALQSARSGIPRAANTRAAYLVPVKQSSLLRTILVGFRSRLLVVKR